ncbi:MAG: hypothetical protein GX572_00160 [Clostridia bacterium]|nr:hypothetical protein [Clostridia bacterium]
MAEKQLLICDKCQVALEISGVHFSYLNHSFQAQVPRCPNCGQVYLTEDFVTGRMRQVEWELEDK